MAQEVLGEFLRFLRKKHNLTLQKLSELVDVDNSYLSEIENGKKAGSFGILTRIAEVYAIKPGIFLDIWAGKVTMEKAIENINSIEVLLAKDEVGYWLKLPEIIAKEPQDIARIEEYIEMLVERRKRLNQN